MKRLSAVGCQLSALMVACVAHAQTATTGVPAERFSPAVGPTALVGVEGAAVTPAGALSWAASVDAVGDPINLRTAFTDMRLSEPVDYALVADLALELGVWKRLALAVGVPVVLYQQGDRLQGTGTSERALATTVAGDVRIRAKASLVEGKRLGAAVLLQVTAPARGQSDFAATDGATVEPRLVVDAHLGRLTLAASVGARFQKERTLFTTQFGDELTWAAAAAAAIVQRPMGGLVAIVEAAGGVGPSAGTRPAEIRGALRVPLGAVALDVGGGAGLDGDVGAAAWRVFLVARSGWSPSVLR
ncbi:MAG TPA: hypothetical protein VF334_04525 [Polyangia bacterium]